MNVSGQNLEAYLEYMESDWIAVLFDRLLHVCITNELIIVSSFI